MIARCTPACEDSKSPAAAFQNARYGPGLRVMNPKKDGGKRCTVCGTEHVSGASKKK